MQDKGIFRKLAKNIRETLDKKGEIDKISNNIVKKIVNSNEFKKASNIALYFAFKGEVNISSLTKFKGKNFYFPRCNKDNLEFVKFNSFDDFSINKYGIMEPKGIAINPEILDLIYVPCVLATPDCHRIGWGKGYYDRFFNEYKLNAKKVIVSPKILIVNDLPHEKHDIKCDLLICED